MLNSSLPLPLTDEAAPMSASRAVASTPARPAALPVKFGHIPAALKAEPRWCVWKYSLNEQRRKWGKTPVDANTLRFAKSNDPATWSDYDTAVKALGRDPSLAGLGFFLGDGWTGIDIDDCHDLLNGFNDIATDVLACAPGYAEISPSATGVKIILRAPIPRSKQKQHGDTGLEIYDHGRFFTITGHAVPGRDNSIPPVSNIDALYARYFDGTGQTTPSHAIAHGDALVGAVPRLKDITIARLRDDLRWLDPEMPEPEWFRVICAINHQFCDTDLEDDAKEVALKWTDQGSKADPDGFEDRWERARPNPGVVPVTYATIVKMVNELKAAESLDEAVARLADLSALEFDRIARDEAKRLGVKVSNLEKAVKEARAEGANADGGDLFEPVEPWHETVNGEAMLNELVTTVQRFIVCQLETAQAVALWITMSWLMHVVGIAPLAVITAPEKRCGKTQLLDLMSRLVFRPLASSNISPAALYRAIDAWSPTLLLDETDAALKGNEDLRGLLNSGHTRPSAFALRTVGDDHQPKRFSTWGAKALAGIGHLAPTLMDRAILLELRRKLPHERVEKLRHNEEEPFKRLRSQLARWTSDNAEAVRLARPTPPESLHDRAADNWEPLMQIAAVAGGAWPAIAHNAALVLSDSDDATPSAGVELLTDIRAAFDRKLVATLPLADLLDELLADDEAPWSTWNRGRPMNARQLGKKLREFAIASRSVRFGNRVKKSLSLDQFAEAFQRYLTDVPSDGEEDPAASVVPTPSFLD
ncbi:hypothetical protein OKW30_002550 [Paraburkholderia sp. Clong3]|uniref:DUF3631 domain-containing protein n=1 Tax=Paraburkholderia sp. Clong3 TaxID=2991061 RepID=UPI003D26315E